MDELRKIQSFMFSAWGIFSAGPVFFPLFDQFVNIVYVPTPAADRALLVAINSLICSFILLFFFLLQSRQRNLLIPVVLFLVGIGSLLWYQNLVSPIEALRSLGIVADISYLSGYDENLYKGLYWMIFASFTGAFTSLAAFFYRPRYSRYW